MDSTHNLSSKTAKTNNMKGCYCLLVIALSFTGLRGQGECTKGNCHNGIGSMVIANLGEYNGNFVDRQRHGNGIMHYLNGDKYLGNWRLGQREGEGRMQFARGDVYQGGFASDDFAGRGVLIFANGTRYEGEFENGYFQGRGKMLSADGVVFEGGWEKGRRHGFGSLTFRDGTEVSGKWDHGRYRILEAELNFVERVVELRNCNEVFCELGDGQYTFFDGTRYYGQFVGGAPNGLGTAIYANGNRYDGRWRKGSPEGAGVMQYAGGGAIGALWESGRPKHKIFQEGKVDPRAKTVPVPDNEPSVVDWDPKVRIWAVLVGAAEYRHMPLLKYTDDDAYQLYAFLKSPEGGALPDAQLRLLIDEQATIANINKAVQNTFMRADENDVILFYFSGHGVQGAFLPTDFDGINNQLKHSVLRKMIERSQAKHKIVIADACHSGSLFAFDGPSSRAIQQYYTAFETAKEGTALLMSSKGEEYSLEDGGLRSGIFSHFMIKGLKGEADVNQDQIITIVELFEYVRFQVTHFTDHVQTPVLFGDYDKRLPLAMTRY